MRRTCMDLHGGSIMAAQAAADFVELMAAAESRALAKLSRSS